MKISLKHILTSIAVISILSSGIFFGCSNGPSDEASSGDTSQDSSSESTSGETKEDSDNSDSSSSETQKTKILPARSGKTKSTSASGLSESRVVTGTVNGINCEIYLDAKTGNFTVKKSDASRSAVNSFRAADDISVSEEAAEGNFYYRDGVLSLELTEDTDSFLEASDTEISEDNPLYIAVDYDEASDTDFDSEDVKTGTVDLEKDDSEDNSPEIPDAYIDFASSREINEYTIVKPVLPASSGTNPFTLNFKYMDGTPQTAWYEFTEDKAIHCTVISDDDTVRQEYYYSYNTEDQTIYMLSTAFDNDYQMLLDEAKDYEYDSFIEGKTEDEIKEKFKYYRAFYGLSDDTSNEEVLNVMYRHEVRNFKSEHLVSAYKYRIEGEDLLLTHYLSNKTTLKDFFENGTANMCFQADSGNYHYPLGQGTFQPLDITKYRANFVYQVLDVIETADNKGYLTITKEWFSEGENSTTITEPHMVFLEYEEINYYEDSDEATVFIKTRDSDVDDELKPLVNGLTLKGISGEPAFYTKGAALWLAE